MNFVHLHTHSEFSILDSTDSINGLLDKAEENDMEALALTDHGNIGGAIKFYQEATDRGIKPILGCELYVAPGSRLDKQKTPKESNEARYYHLVVLAKSNSGFRNLMKLTSLGHTEGFYYKPRVDRELLRQHSEGLIALSACKSGAVPKALLNDDYERAVEEARELAEIFGSRNFYIELQDQEVEGQQKLNSQLKEVARDLDLSLVATNDVHYLNEGDELAHEVLLNIQANKTLNDEDRRRYEGNEYYFKSPTEMEERFSDTPSALRNTAEIAERCDVELEFSETYLPPFEIPDKFDGPEEHLRHLVEKGAKERWEEITPKIQQRLDHELEVIYEMGYPTYFLIVRDFIEYARKEGIPVGPGRGSAAGSAVAYCLRITDVDPLKHGLLFERFLNPARVSMPDIDIDFCKDGRDKVIEYVRNKYGKDQVAQIATFDTMAARSAIRDVARVMDIPYNTADQIAKAIPTGTTLDKALENVSELKERYESDDNMKQLFDISRKLEGLMRNASTHAAGVVIAPGKLTDYTPLQRLSDDEIVTQFDMEDLEEIGLLKMDFLGLRNLTIIEDCLDLIEQQQGERPNLDQISMSDPDTFELLRNGHTNGVFQLESSGMQNLLQRLQPGEFEDIIASNALYRPGPLESGMTEDYIKRKNGQEEIDYPHPDLEEVLEETYGLPIYQEQIMKMAQVLAGFSLAEADKLRKAMGKKKQQVMNEMEEKFVQGCVDNGISKQEAISLFSDIDKFSRYGFNKSHSTAYAYISYWTAWLKANFPAKYMASLLTSVGGNEDKVAKYVKECQEMGIEVLPPNVNESNLRFTPVSSERIRFGLGAIKYVGQDTARSIINSRPEKGYTTFFEFCRNVDPQTLNSEALESLIKVGALDDFGTRKYLLSRLNEGLEVSSLLADQRNSGQKSFFDEDDTISKETKPREEMEEFSRNRVLQFEKKFLGLFISGDPLHDYELELQTFSTCPLSGISEISNDGEIWVGGRIIDLSQIQTQKGDPMAFVTLKDGQGEQEIIVFPNTFEKTNGLLAEDTIILVKGRFDQRNGEEQLIAQEIIDLDSVWDRASSKLTVSLNARQINEGNLKQIKQMLNSREGSTSIELKVVDSEEGRYSLLAASPNYRPKLDKDLVHRLLDLDLVQDATILPSNSEQESQ